MHAAARFRALHLSPPILVLPNAWDVTSALLFARAGARAVATTSSGVAAVLGYADGERIGRDEMLDMVERIVRAVSVPVTADLEAGYGDPAGTARLAVDVGAAGMNLEDGAGPIDEHVKRIGAVRDAVGDALVLNARVDTFIGGAATVEDAVERANAYLRAGADCAFVIGIGDGERIAALAQAVGGPLNVHASAETPNAAELQRLGVARVTVGSGAMRAAAATTAEVAEQLRHGEFGWLEDAYPSAELQRILGEAL